MRVIQIGIGGFGEVWLDTVARHNDVHHVAYVEVSEDMIAKQVNERGIDRAHVYPTLAAALEHVQADAVINVTPPALHRVTSIQALEAGLPVLSEKPLAATIDDAQAIVTASQRTGVLHVVAQNYRHNAAMQTVKRALTAGDLGTMSAITVEFLKGVRFGGFREQMPYPLIIDMAIHHFDLLRFMLDDDPISVYGLSYNPSWSWFDGDAATNIAFRFARGAVASYHGSWVTQGQETTWNGNWRFECERGALTLRDDRVFVQGVAQLEPSTIPGRINIIYDELREIPLIDAADTGQGAILDGFMDAVMNGGATPATTCVDNIKSLGMVFGAVQSFESGQVIALPLS